MSEGLPTFNYRDIVSPDRALLETLRTTCHLTGFFYLHHPELVSGSLNNMFQHAREFFALPETEKNAIHLHRHR